MSPRINALISELSKWGDLQYYIKDFIDKVDPLVPLTLKSDARVCIEKSASGTMWFQYDVGCGFTLPPRTTDEIRILCRHAKEFRELAKEKKAAVTSDLDMLLEAMKP